MKEGHCGLCSLVEVSGHLLLPPSVVSPVPPAWIAERRTAGGTRQRFPLADSSQSLHICCISPSQCERSAEQQELLVGLDPHISGPHLPPTSGTLRPVF